MDTALSVIFFTALYFTPTIIAAIKHKRNLVAIFMMNLLLGWTVIGWIVALIWALTVDVRK